MDSYQKELEEKRQKIIERLDYIDQKRLVTQLLKAELERIDLRLNKLKNSH